ncbi:hypothetical protein [Sinorhizobium mexicanum]|nr:hypothetical protein [Sinorhizobium mexicanum]MBP1885522.1 hypothetical protein [Sinorhizobium mexicanum]
MEKKTGSVKKTREKAENVEESAPCAIREFHASCGQTVDERDILSSP